MYKTLQRRSYLADGGGTGGGRDAQQESHHASLSHVKCRDTGSPHKAAGGSGLKSAGPDMKGGPSSELTHLGSRNPVVAGKPKPSPVKGGAGLKVAQLTSATKWNKGAIMGLHLTETRALMLLNIIAILYGTNTTMMKAILTATGKRASAATAARSLAGALAVMPMLMDKRVVNVELWKVGTELGMWLGLGCACQSNALRTSTSSEASVMLALTLVVVSILEICCGRPVTARRVLPVLMAVAGLLLMEAGNGPVGSASLADPEYVSDGTMWGVASAIGFGVHLFRSDVTQERVSDSVKLGALQLVTCAGFHSVWLAFDYLFSFGPGEATRVLANLPWGEVVFCGVFATGVAQFLELVCVKYAKASSTAIVFAQVPVVGMLLGFFVQSDRLSLLSLLGSVLVISAAAVPHLLTYVHSIQSSSKASLKRTPPSKHHTVISMPKPSTSEMPGKKVNMDANILSPRRRADVECAVHCHT